MVELDLGRDAYSIKALQVIMAVKTVRYESTEDGKVAGNDAVFRDTTYDNRNSELTGEGNRPSPLTGHARDFLDGAG